MQCSICRAVIIVPEGTSEAEAVYAHYRESHPDIIALLHEDEAEGAPPPPLSAWVVIREEGEEVP